MKEDLYAQQKLTVTTVKHLIDTVNGWSISRSLNTGWTPERSTIVRRPMLTCQPGHDPDALIYSLHPEK